MKKGTRNLLIVGAVGLAGYFFVVKPALDKVSNPAALGSDLGGAAVGGVQYAADAGLGFLSGFNNALLGAILSPFTYAGAAVSTATAPLISGVNNALFPAPAAPSNPLPVANNQTPYYRGGAAEPYFQAAINSSSNQARTTAPTYQGTQGTYNTSTMTFTSNTGLKSSVAPKYVTQTPVSVPVAHPYISTASSLPNSSSLLAYMKK